jgi:hypothetical protein
MVLCHNKKCIFIHIPKTGGTSIEHFLRENGKNELLLIGISSNNRSMQHYTAFELKINIPYFFKIYYKFSIVRNPYERLLSEYYWTPIYNVGFNYGRSLDQFLTYVEYVVKNKRYHEHINNDHFMPQFLFLYNNGKLLVNQLFKYEDMGWIETYLKKKLIIENNILVLNKTHENIKKVYWNNMQKERIYKLYRKDFELFNYEK